MNTSSLDALVNWSGSQEELSATVSRFIELNEFASGKKVSKRTITYYRTKGLIGKPDGKKYGYKHILQCLLSIKFSYEGWKIQQMSATVPGLNTDELIFYLNKSVKFEELLRPNIDSSSSDYMVKDNIESGDLSSLPLPHLAVRVLAGSVLEQYSHVLKGRIVDGSAMPNSFRQALGLLGKLRVLEAKEDNCASIHEVLKKATDPFYSDKWDIDAFKESSFPYSGVSLIDMNQRCPTLECVELANPATDSDIREMYSFDRFKKLCASHGAARHDVYAEVRAFIARNAMVRSKKLTEFIRKKKLNNFQEFLRDDCFAPIGDYHLIDGELYTCSECGSILKKASSGIGRCAIRQCLLFQKDVALSKSKTYDDSFLVLRPHLQAYWFGPGLDELKLYEACLENNIQVTLYPNSDECDLAIDGKDIGIDIKSHASPILLGETLSKSIGGLRGYQRKIVGINDNCLDSREYPDYVKKLISSYRGSIKLEFMSVSRLLEWIEKTDE